MRNINEPARMPRRVRVSDRDDTGLVIQEGKNFGAPGFDVRCVVVHFPATGEVAFCDMAKVETVQD